MLWVDCVVEGLLINVKGNGKGLKPRSGHFAPSHFPFKPSFM